MSAQRRTPHLAMIVDPDLPGLARALDAEHMRPRVARAAGLAQEPSGLRLVPEVLSHKPRRRATIRYAWLGRSAGGRAPRPVIGKLYRSRRRAMRAYERMAAVSSEIHSVPACLEPPRSLGLFFQQWVEGIELDHVVATGSDERPLVQAAHWLRTLHGSPRPSTLPVVSGQNLIAKVHLWCEALAAGLPEAARSTREAREAFAASVASQSTCRPALIHKDFYHAQVLWSGERIWVLDFDELSLGDPAFDIGHFVAHLEYKAYLNAGSEHAYDDATTRFTGSYDPIGAGWLARLPPYKAYTFLKLAHTEVVRRRELWGPRAELLLRLALRELGALPDDPARQRLRHPGGVTKRE